MNVKLENYSAMPDDVVRRLLRVAAPPGLRRVEVLIQEGSRGMRLPFVANANPDALPPPYIAIKLHPTWRFPWYQRNSAEQSAVGYMSYGWVESREELLLLLLAHELRHVWQATHVGRLSANKETDAELWALGRREIWRSRREAA